MLRPDNLIFDIYFADEKVGHIEVLDGVLIKNEVYTDIWWKNPFMSARDFDLVFHIFKDRTIPRERGNIAEILSDWGLKEYNVYDMIEHTHGVTHDDLTWLKFSSDREDLGFRDVYPWKNRW